MLDPNKYLGFYPGILHSSRLSWEVQKEEPIKARVDLANRKAFVPEALTDIDVHIQNHEYGHVKISKAVPSSDTDVARFDYFLEEVRVNLWLRHHGIPYARALDGFDWSKMPRPSDRQDAALQWLQVCTYILYRKSEERPADLSVFFADCQGMLLSPPANGRHIADTAVLIAAVNAISKDLRGSVRAEWAARLAEHFAKPKPPEKPPEEKEEYKAEREAEAKRREKEAKLAEEREKEAGKLKGGANRLGCMDIHRHMTRAKPGRRIAQPFGSTDMGAMPTQFARKSIDGKVFKRKKPSGAIVIDCSGSMSWDYDVLQNLIKSLPNLVVATYQGYSGIPGVHGRLCVLAENGRWCPPEWETRFNGGNEVDYEALEWASKITDGPVVWLSDGAVCGGSRDAKQTEDLCDALMKRRGIVRIRREQDAADYLRRKTVKVFRNCGQSRPAIISNGRMR